MNITHHRGRPGPFYSFLPSPQKFHQDPSDVEKSGFGIDFQVLIGMPAGGHDDVMVTDHVESRVRIGETTISTSLGRALRR